MKQADFLIVGAGIFGVCTALELIGEGHSVILINSGSIPHELAASTDISKVVRMEYGSDREYMEMAIRSMETWRDWNHELADQLYHETGYLLLSKDGANDPAEYESSSYRLVTSRGFSPEKLSATSLADRFPAFAAGIYQEAYFHSHGGFAESGRAVASLVALAKRKGVDVREDMTMVGLVRKGSRVIGISTDAQEAVHAGQVILCTGNLTPYLLPELKPFMRITGHPVFHLKPRDTKFYQPHQFPVFAADISKTGWYGFPVHPREGVVKIARHSEGLELDPRTDERLVYQQDKEALKAFVRESLPGLVGAPLVYTRRCCYTDTLDGHFWIDRHPGLEGLTVGSGGSGHGFKMGPEVGRMIACRALNKEHGWSGRYQWRDLKPGTIQKEEARFLVKRAL